MRVYSKGGSTLQTNNLTSFFGAAADQTSTDNKVVFDQGSGRYYMANLLVNCCDVNNNPDRQSDQARRLAELDPTGSWCVYGFGFFTDTSGNILDQPKLGFSDDKITITENLNGNGGGSLMDVLQKSDAIAGCGGLAGTGFTTNDFNVMPAISLSSTGDQYAIFNDGGGTAKILDITGTPTGGGVSCSETDKGIFGLNTRRRPRSPEAGRRRSIPATRVTRALYSRTVNSGPPRATPATPAMGNHACIRVDEFDTTNSFNILHRPGAERRQRKRHLHARGFARYAAAILSSATRSPRPRPSPRW